MKCPKCEAKMYASDTRSKDNYVRRRRTCERCGGKISTREYNLEYIQELLYIKKQHEKMMEIIRNYD